MTPEGLNERMKEFHLKWNEGEATSMRSGVVSRMSELGLLNRTKDGVKVTYGLTQHGEEFLTRLGD